MRPTATTPAPKPCPGSKRTPASNPSASSPPSRAPSPPTASRSRWWRSSRPFPASWRRWTTCRGCPCRRAIPTATILGRPGSPCAASTRTSRKPRSAPPSTAFRMGTSDYWSGSKANRFIDMANLGEVTVSQGTADVGSRSVEALGGTLDFTSSDPAQERKTTAAATFGDHAAQRYYLRLDTGPLFGSDTRAWVSVVHQRTQDWMQGVVDVTRDHAAAKVESWIGNTQWTAMASYDDLFSASYQRVLSDEEYRADPRWDRLLADWTGTPYLDQLHRPGWGTPRTDGFGYVKFETTVSERTVFSGGVYAHSQWGRGDWVPPFLVDLIDDAGGAETEITGHRCARRRVHRAALFRLARGSRTCAVRRVRFLHHLPLRRRRSRIRPRLSPARRNPRAVLPPQPLRQAAHGAYARRRVECPVRDLSQSRSRRTLVRGQPPRPGPRLAPHPRHPTGRGLHRCSLLASVRVGVPADHRQTAPSGHPHARPAGGVVGARQVFRGGRAQRRLRRGTEPHGFLRL